MPIKVDFFQKRRLPQSLIFDFRTIWAKQFGKFLGTELSRRSRIVKKQEPIDAVQETSRKR